MMPRASSPSPSASGSSLIAIEALWRRPRSLAPLDEPAGHRRREALDWLLTAYLVLIWLHVGARSLGVFRRAIVALVLPVAFSVMNRAASHLLRPANDDVSPARSASLATVYVERGLRAVLILAAALFLARFWEIDLVQLTGRDTPLTRLVRGALSAIVIFLVADLLWQVLKTLIDRQLAGGARRDRASTTKPPPARRACARCCRSSATSLSWSSRSSR